MSKKSIKNPESVVVPVRVPKDMQQRVRRVSDRAGLSDADIMRMSIIRGLVRVEEMFPPQAEAAA